MTILNVRHTTVYRYRHPVRLGDHRLMLRPRDSHDLRLIGTDLKFSPPASVRWVHDVFGNSVAIASFTQPAAELRIESSLQLETYAVEQPVPQIAPSTLVSERGFRTRAAKPRGPRPRSRASTAVGVRAVILPCC
jgi:transglutaminase-like putative cysteine protease